MDYLETILARLSASDLCGYQPHAPAATEPTALAAVALVAHGRETAARPMVDRLVEMQNDDGSVGISLREQQPCWPTGLAVLAWRAAQLSPIFDVRYVTALDRGLSWILATRGVQTEQGDTIGHDTTIPGWPWVHGTHSWVEPTAINLLALLHTYQATHPRAHDARRLLIDRILADGGCNYGNTVVFGQQLRAHVQPTGLCLMALGDVDDPSGRIARSIEYLQRELSAETPTLSLCYGLLGLAAQGAIPTKRDEWLAAAAHRTLARDPASHKLALLALASQGPSCPLISQKRSRAEIPLP